ncbi:M50 family metallopeptidase [Vibrio owensii]|uniref:M50 family metallopeptidase n=1 Tax=Vibrio harveyi group TaxID=717610 RepID=UPI003CC59F0D
MLQKLKQRMLSLLNNSYLFFTVSLVISVLLLMNHTSIGVYYFKVLITPVSVFLHEASHGLAALAVGFDVTELMMKWRSGHVISVGPSAEMFSRGIISFAGYAGATIFGLILFLSSMKWRTFFMSMIVLMAMYFTCFYKDTQTLIVMAYVIGLLVICALPYGWISYILRFMGAYIMTSSVISPIYQLEHSRHSDSMNLVSYFGFTELFYVCLWIAFSCSVIGLSFYLLRRADIAEAKLQETLAKVSEAGVAQAAPGMRSLP